MACSPLVGAECGDCPDRRAAARASWRSTSSPARRSGTATDDEAGYASPIAATISGRRYLLAFTRAGLNALEPSSGKVFFQFPFRSPMDASVNAASPVVVGDQIFLSACYETGATLASFQRSGS